MIKKVLWFSRHEMSSEQLADLGQVEVIKIDKTVANAYELQAEIEGSDIIAIVAPINLQQQFLKIAGDKPVILAQNRRIVDGDNKVAFKHNGWKRLIKIVVEMEDFKND